MATYRRKVIGTATIEYNGAPITLGVTAVPTGVSPAVETDTVSAFGDDVATAIPRNVATLDTFDIECIYEGTAPAIPAGKCVNLVVSLQFRNGVDADVDVADAIDETVFCSHVAFGSVEVDGDRKASITFTFQPVGGEDRSDVDFDAPTP